MFGTIYDGIVGKELCEIDRGQRFAAGRRAQANINILVVLMPHYVSTGREQSGLIFGFEQIVGCLSACTIFEIGAG